GRPTGRTPGSGVHPRLDRAPRHAGDATPRPVQARAELPRPQPRRAGRAARAGEAEADRRAGEGADGEGDEVSGAATTARTKRNGSAENKGVRSVLCPSKTPKRELTPLVPPSAGRPGCTFSEIGGRGNERRAERTRRDLNDLRTSPPGARPATTDSASVE